MSIVYKYFFINNTFKYCTIKKTQISLIIDPRQAAKATLMLLLKDYVEKRGEKIVSRS